MAAFATRFCLRHCVFLCKGTKLQNSAQAEFWDCTPVLANETGGLGLWLGAFEKSRLYRCQSTPGPPMPDFCGTELRFGSLCNLGLSKKLRFSLQRHKAPEFGEAEFWDSLPVFCGTETDYCKKNRRASIQKYFLFDSNC